MPVIPEHEWRKIRDMKPALLDRVCKGILDELRAKIVISSTDQVHHKQYLKVYKWLDEQDQIIGTGFNDLKRRNAYFLVAFWVKSRWLTQQEFDRLSEVTKAKVIFLAGLDQYSPPEI